ncbi:MAG TPA: hypothetical protein VF381_02830, partial [Thermoanaerobaculia bacterium]
HTHPEEENEEPGEQPKFRHLGNGSEPARRTLRGWGCRRRLFPVVIFGRFLSLLGRKIKNVSRGVVVLLPDDDLDSAGCVRIEPVDRDDFVVEECDLDASGLERRDRSLRFAKAGKPFDDCEQDL